MTPDPLALRGGYVDAIIGSPPYEGSQVIASGVQRNEDAWGKGRDLSAGKSKHYGHAAGQLGALPAGSFEEVIMRMQVDAVIGSPPYATGTVQDHDSRENYEDLNRRVLKAGKGHGGTFGPSVGQSYGAAPGQLASMKEGQQPVTTTTTVPVDQWQSLYGEQWKGLIVPDAFGHPAKYGRGLIRHIYSHLALTPGSVVLDPFGGVALGALDAILSGLVWVGVELEPKHHQIGGEGWPCPGSRHLPRYDKANPCKEAVWPVCARCLKDWQKDDHRHSDHHAQGNLEAWRGRYGGPGKATLCLGDSRRLREVVGPVLVEAVVSSPPYTHDPLRRGGLTPSLNPNRAASRQNGLVAMQESYSDSDTPGQLGSLPEGSLADALVSSPPYAGVSNERVGRPMPIDPTKGKYPQNRSAESVARREADYGHSEGQLADLPPGSLADALGQGADAVVSSPPYEGCLNNKPDAHRLEALAKNPNGSNRLSASQTSDYGTAPGQLGAESGQTFWEASAAIVRECYALLKPGGVAVFVCKSFVRSGVLVEFPSQWRQLCEAAGFVTEHIHHAMLTEDLGEDPDLFGPSKRKSKKRCSFFRRLAEKKGAPKIDFEEVICLRKRLTWP